MLEVFCLVDLLPETLPEAFSVTEIGDLAGSFDFSDDLLDLCFLLASVSCLVDDFSFGQDF